ncbi:helix-turn-helix transcriptional regulator [Spiribacter halobius]|uniref:HTH luxR-type domain-containing protein n=1 Tax=Sediminicurvatus halobius TaxID=2182432 RepID=A0A2U2N6C9_9GAMM|nr:helix-turn-helix transcriptional regulator [Spiribacter halobius]PWG64652.1 hypothetical protein DEM34_04815 [Spiribacter halobius]UEX79024.1 helix-turn-helix transcriptional regulator [Spiribacter halobius]
MTQRGTEAFADILDGLYASAIEGRPWAMDAIRGWVGTDCANVCLINADNVVYGGACSALTASDRVTYLEQWAADDAPARAMLEHPRRVCTDTQALPRRSLEATDAFQGFYEPLGIAHQGLAKASLPGGRLVGISVQNGWRAGPIPPAALERAARLTAHLRRAVHLANTLALARGRVAASDQLLAQWRVGLLRCRPDGRVLDMQGAVEALLRASGPALRLEAGRLRLGERGANRRLAELLSDPHRRAGSRGDSLTLASVQGGQALELTILADGADADAEARLVMIRDASGPDRVDLDHLRQRLALTRVEAEVLGHLMMGRDVAAIAEMRGCTLATIRSYLKTLRRKLACSSQAQLVALGWRSIGFCPSAR